MKGQAKGVERKDGYAVVEEIIGNEQLQPETARERIQFFNDSIFINMMGFLIFDEGGAE